MSFGLRGSWPATCSTAHFQQPGSGSVLTPTNPSQGGSSRGVPLPGNQASPTWQLGLKAELGGGAALLPWLTGGAARVGLLSVEFYIFQLTFYFAYKESYSRLRNRGDLQSEFVHMNRPGLPGGPYQTPPARDTAGWSAF